MVAGSFFGKVSPSQPKQSHGNNIRGNCKIDGWVCYEYFVQKFVQK
jgi:hypothetical protein